MRLIKKIKKKLGRFLYYSVAIKLPVSYSKGGKFGRLFRETCARQFLLNVGKNINIEKGAMITSTMEIGDNSGVGINAQIYGKVILGENVMMGSECMIYTANHNFNRVDIPMNRQGFSEEKPVVVGNDVWIGGRVTILPGVHIGNGVVIGAGAVVTKDIPDFAVVGGNPAKVIRYREGISTK